MLSKMTGSRCSTCTHDTSASAIASCDDMHTAFIRLRHGWKGLLRWLQKFATKVPWIELFHQLELRSSRMQCKKNVKNDIVLVACKPHEQYRQQICVCMTSCFDPAVTLDGVFESV